MKNLLQQRISPNFSGLDRNPALPYFNTLSSGFFPKRAEIEQASSFRYEAHELTRLNLYCPSLIKKFKEVPFMGLVPLHVRGRDPADIEAFDIWRK